MAYQFNNEQAATAYIVKEGTSDKYKIAGVNGEQINAENFKTAMTGLLRVVGKENDADTGLGRSITQEVEESP